MFTEKFFESPGASSMTTYVWEIALILLGAFILGYLLRYLLNGKYKTRISTLEQKLALLENKTSEDANTKEEVEALLVKAREQKSEIDKLNTRLSDSFASKIKAENQLAALQTKYDQLSLRADSSVPKAEMTDVSDSQTSGIIASSTSNPSTDSGVVDDLKKIEGIGPKIEQLLNADGITSFTNLIEASVERVKGILTAAGPNYAVHDPTTWAEQAKLAKDGKWEALDELQEELKGGKRK